MMKMCLKCCLLLATLLAGSFALPAPEADLSQYFIHTEQNPRIVGGTVAEAGSAPYMVSISNGFIARTYICGGSVIGTRTVLTAAHCIDAVFSRLTGLSRNLRLTVGTNLNNVYGREGDSYSVSRNVTHQHYVHSIIKNDIGLLIAASNIVFHNLVAPAPLGTDFVPGGVRAKVTGWGRTGQNQAASSQLLELYVTIVDGQQCVEEMKAALAANNFWDIPVDPALEICTFHSAGHGTCNGDSGSALVDANTGQQIGVVSWGIPCARGGPDVFVRVSAYAGWLAENVV